MILNSMRLYYLLWGAMLIGEGVTIIHLLSGSLLLFWFIELVATVYHSKQFKSNAKYCKMVKYLSNASKCKNKGDYQNRAVFSNNVFFASTLLLLFYLSERDSHQ